MALDSNNPANKREIKPNVMTPDITPAMKLTNQCHNQGVVKNSML